MDSDGGSQKPYHIPLAQFQAIPISATRTSAVGLQGDDSLVVCLRSARPELGELLSWCESCYVDEFV